MIQYMASEVCFVFVFLFFFSFFCHQAATGGSRRLERTMLPRSHGYKASAVLQVNTLDSLVHGEEWV